MRFSSISILCVSALFSMNLTAQSIKNCLQRMPETVFPFLTATNLADMPDFIQSGMQAKVKNRFSETTEMMVMRDDFVEMKLGDLASVQMKLLQGKDGKKQIALIHTVEVPEKDSRLRLFTTEWEELSVSDCFERPAMASFLCMQEEDSSQADSMDQERLKRQKALGVLQEIPLLYIRFDSDVMMISWSGIERLGEEEKKEIEPYIKKETQNYRWNGSRFERID